MSDDRGFTLVEVLVVILVIGVLAGIALPTFLGQRDKAHDASVKSDLRNAVTQMESCFTPNDRYSSCPDASSPVASGITVSIASDGQGYTLSEESRAGVSFSIEHTATANRRLCTAPGDGGCRAGGSW